MDELPLPVLSIPVAVSGRLSPSLGIAEAGAFDWRSKTVRRVSHWDGDCVVLAAPKDKKVERPRDLPAVVVQIQWSLHVYAGSGVQVTCMMGA